MKTFVSLVKAHQSVPSVQEDFNDRKTHFVDISQVLLSLLNGLMNKVAVMDGGYAQTQQYGLHSLRLTCHRC